MKLGVWFLEGLCHVSLNIHPFQAQGITQY